MSSHVSQTTWFDRWWQVLVIAFAVLFVIVLGNFNPKI